MRFFTYYKKQSRLKISDVWLIEHCKECGSVLRVPHWLTNTLLDIRKFCIVGLTERGDEYCVRCDSLFLRVRLGRAEWPLLIPVKL